MRLLYIFIIILFTSCTVTQSYTEYGIKTLINNEYQSDKVSGEASIKINTTFKFINVEFAGKKFSYRIESYKYVYDKNADNIKENRIGIDIHCKMGHILYVRWNQKDHIPYTDLYYKDPNGSETIVYFNNRNDESKK